MLPFAPEVNPEDVAATVKPPLAGGTVATLHGVVAVELPEKALIVVPFPLPPAAAPS